MILEMKNKKTRKNFARRKLFFKPFKKAKEELSRVYTQQVCVELYQTDSFLKT